MRGKRLRRPAELVAAGLVPAERAAEIAAVAERFAVAITPEMAALIEPEELADPIADRRLSPVKGIVHRYPDRVLLKPGHACPVYCRFCFRREQVGPGGEALDAAELETALDYIRARPELWEVIVTGGDPFVLSPRRIGADGAVPRHGDGAHQALLPAPSGSRPRHGGLPPGPCQGPRSDGGAARARFRALPAQLCAGPAGRPRQGAGGPVLCRAGRISRGLARLRPLGRAAPLSAARPDRLTDNALSASQKVRLTS